jgi:Rps23 Pro-64 3,4-dihydroxylase Tpa1-like proline 4-hydroxylase
MDVYTIEDILDEKHVQKLLSLVDDEKENFQPNKDEASAVFLYYDKQWFSDKLHSMINQIVTGLNRATFKPDPSKFECFLTKNCNETAARRRQREIGYSYHFYNAPQQFTGGEMIYLDIRQNTIVTLPPKRNSIVFYEASLLYSVTPTIGSDRYTIHGYISS